MTSAIRQNYYEDCEAAINKQINMFLYAEYVTRAMSYHFQRDDVAFTRIVEYYELAASFFHEQTEMLSRYQNLRGGRIVLQDIQAPSVEWNHYLNAFQDFLALARRVNESLLVISEISSNHEDAHLSFYIVSNHINPLVDIIHDISKQITNAKRSGDGLGEAQFAKNLDLDLMRSLF